MSYTSQHSTGCDESSILNWFGLKANQLSLLLLRLHRRRHLATLAKLSNRQLSDIGLQRGDIYESAALGMGDDVTTHLAKIAKRRRRQLN